MTDLASRSGGEILVRHLMINGVRRVFMVAGESFLPCIDSLYAHRDEIATVSFRQEGGAAYAAEAHGKLTGEPGICFVTRGPGATNASIGVHTAYQDGTPMILFVGQIGSDTVERDCFQEVDYRRMFGSMAKWVASIDRTDRIPEFIARAFQVARSGRPGPVVLALPEDTLWGQAAVPDVLPGARAHAHPAPTEISRLAELLEGAERPFMIVGGASWSDVSLAQVRGFAERYDLPVGVSWRRLECFDNRHPNFAGHIGYGMDRKLAQRIEDADLLLAVCTRLDEPTTEGYVHVTTSVPRQSLCISTLIQTNWAVSIGPNSPWWPIPRASVPPSRPFRRPENPAGTAPRRMPTRTIGRPSSLVRCRVKPTLRRFPLRCATGCPKCVHHSGRRQLRAVSPSLPAIFRSRHASLPGLRRHGLWATRSNRRQTRFSREDRALLRWRWLLRMTMQELGTAAQSKLGIVILVFNNGMSGTIRQHQEREYPLACSALR